MARSRGEKLCSLPKVDGHHAPLPASRAVYTTHDTREEPGGFGELVDSEKSIRARPTGQMGDQIETIDFASRMYVLHTSFQTVGVEHQFSRKFMLAISLRTGLNDERSETGIGDTRSSQPSHGNAGSGDPQAASKGNISRRRCRFWPPCVG